MNFQNVNRLLNLVVPLLATGCLSVAPLDLDVGTSSSDVAGQETRTSSDLIDAETGTSIGKDLSTRSDAAAEGVQLEVDETCVPDCNEKTCGPDGCGGSCGVCPDGWKCLGGVCDNSCGDGACTDAENECNCPEDCESDCIGCCEAGNCLLGNEPTACGMGGDSCVACEVNQECAFQQCIYLCGDEHCAGATNGETECTCPYDCGECNGCCAEGQCFDGKNESHCGIGGESCQECVDSQVCGEEHSCIKMCDVSTIQFQGGWVQKVTFLDVGRGGHSGEALNLDDDSSSCAPQGDCEGGYDNQLSGLLGQLEQFVDTTAELESSIAEGSLVILFETHGWSTSSGTEFYLTTYAGVPVLPVYSCDVVSEFCDYTAKASSFNSQTCYPMNYLNHARVESGVLLAGGDNQVLHVNVPLFENSNLVVTLRRVLLKAQVEGSGNDMSWLSGLLGGCVRKSELMAAVAQLPPEVVAELPISVDMFLNLLDMFVTCDMDTDDDGELDCASIGMKFSTIGAEISGVTTDE